MHRFSQDLKKRSTEDGQNGHTQSRLSDHHKLLSHLTVVSTLLYCEKGVRMPSTDTYDASLLHFEDAAFLFFFASNTRNTRGVTKGVHVGTRQMSTTRSMSTPQTTLYTSCQGVGIHGQL